MKIDKSNFLINLDNKIDKIPGLSTVSNLTNICIKIFIKKSLTEKEINKNRYYLHLFNKKFEDCSILLVPIFGNIFIFARDMIYLKKSDKSKSLLGPVEITDQAHQNFAYLDLCDITSVSQPCKETVELIPKKATRNPAMINRTISLPLPDVSQPCKDTAELIPKKATRNPAMTNRTINLPLPQLPVAIPIAVIVPVQQPAPNPVQQAQDVLEYFKFKNSYSYPYLLQLLQTAPQELQQQILTLLQAALHNPQHLVLLKQHLERHILTRCATF
jgi:hypothetical protein